MNGSVSFYTTPQAPHRINVGRLQFAQPFLHPDLDRVEVPKDLSTHDERITWVWNQVRDHPQLGTSGFAVVVPNNLSKAAASTFTTQMTASLLEPRYPLDPGLDVFFHFEPRRRRIRDLLHRLFCGCGRLSDVEAGSTSRRNNTH